MAQILNLIDPSPSEGLLELISIAREHAVVLPVEINKILIRAMLLFFLAGLAEIGGGYLIWQWLRNGKPLWVGLVGAIIMIMYGVLATRQEFSFGKTYAAYAGIFIAMAVLWGWFIGKRAPDSNE